MSGLNRRPAKTLYGESRTESSNLSLSAINIKGKDENDNRQYLWSN